MRANQRYRRRISRHQPIARRRQGVEVHGPDIPGVLVRVAGEANGVSAGAGVEVARTNLPVTNTLGVGAAVDSATADANGDGVGWAVAKRLKSERGDAGRAEGGACAAGVASGVEGGGAPADLGAFGVVGAGAVLRFGQYEGSRRVCTRLYIPDFASS